MEITLLQPELNAVQRPGTKLVMTIRAYNDSDEVVHVELVVHGKIRCEKRLPPGGGTNLLFMENLPSEEGVYAPETYVRSGGQTEGTKVPVSVSVEKSVGARPPSVTVRNPRVLPS